MKNSAQEILKHLEFKPACKKEYDVYVCRPQIGTRVHNFLENSDYTTTEERPFVISGTAGEMWVIDYKKLSKTYTWLHGGDIGTLSLQASAGVNGCIDWMHLKTRATDKVWNFAAMLPLSEASDYPVNTSWGDVLLANRTGIEHGAGDYIVCSSAGDSPDFNDMWVVNGLVFPATYEIAGATGAQGSGPKATPKPAPLSAKGELLVTGHEVQSPSKAPVSGVKKMNLF